MVSFSTVYVLSRKSKVVHKLLNGMGLPSCNVARIKSKSIFAGTGALDDVEAVMYTTGARGCFRCFGK